MKLIFVSLALIAAVQGSSENGLRVRFGLDDIFGTDSFIALPRLVAEAISEGWAQMTPPDGPLYELDMYCSDDRRMCTLYDPLTGFICGLQFPQKYITTSAYDWTIQGFKSWSAKVNGTDTDFWVTTQYYVTEETLQKSEADRKAARDANITLQENAVWLTGFNGDLVKVPTTVTDIANSNFTKQGCIPIMGQHYYQNMSENTPCSAETMFSWFLLTFNGKIVGTAISTFSTVAEDGGKNWYESSGRSTVEITVPNGPECMYDLVDNFGVTTMHIYYKDDPLNITC